MTRSFAHIYVLDSLKGFGPQKFKQLYVSKVSATEVFKNPNRFPDSEKKGEGFAECASVEGLALVSGFAIGADTIGHVAAYECGGRFSRQGAISKGWGLCDFEPIVRRDLLGSELRGT
jgi:hypothetical protein